MEAVKMFEGNNQCSMCKSALEDGERNFGISLSGYTFVFCNSCFSSRKKEIKKLLHEE
jgi:hypothetical protein